MSIVARIPADGAPQVTRGILAPDGTEWVATLVVGWLSRTVLPPTPGRWIVLETLAGDRTPVEVDVDGYGRAAVCALVTPDVLAVAALAVEEFIDLGHLGSSDRGTEALEEAADV